MSLEILYQETNRRITEVHLRMGEIANQPSMLTPEVKRELQARIENILRFNKIYITKS